MMKTRMKNVVMGMCLLFITLLIISCGKNSLSIKELSFEEQIVGTYEGVYSLNGLKDVVEGTIEIEMNSDSTIWAYCHGGNIDTTFMLGVYEHNDSVFVCLTGDDFYNEYGHMIGHDGYGMGGGMMGGSSHMNSGSTDWNHHMDDSHNDNDEHFGGFDIMNHTFSYKFRDSDDYNSFMHFNGTKLNNN